MGQIAILSVFLIAILALLWDAPKQALADVLHRRPVLIWTLPVLLTAIFCGAAIFVHAWSATLALMLLAYTAAPVLCTSVAGAGSIKRPALLDFIAILLLWLPIEFGAGATLIPKPQQGFLHSVAYGIAIVLGLILFIGYRSMPGLKFNFPSAGRDFWMPVAAFAIIAPVLAILGIAIGFIPPVHAPVQSAGKMAAAAGVIFVGTALPEEILFRSLIQNFLMLRFGSGLRILLIAAFIFGCAHLDNGPQPLPNWRYMILATIAGVAYGLVFQKSSTVLASAGLHMMVDWTKHFFF